MIHNQQGCLPGSEAYYFTPSEMARNILFYFTSVGKFMCDGRYRCDRDYDYGNYLLIFVRHGRVFLSDKNTTTVVEKNQVGFLNCHKPHSYWADVSAEFLWLHFDGPNIEKLFQELSVHNDEKNAFSPKDPERTEKRIHEMILNQRYGKFTTEFNESENIYKLLMELFINLSSTERIHDESGEKAVDEALIFIRQHLGEELSVGTVAAHVGLSESHFSRKFRKVMNSSPKDFIIRRRITEAKHLLKNTSASVKEIAFQVGFNSESHFINTFTEKNGLSPKQFRDFPI